LVGRLCIDYLSPKDKRSCAQLLVYSTLTSCEEICAKQTLPTMWEKMVNKTCSRGKHADYLAQNVLAVFMFWCLFASIVEGEWYIVIKFLPSVYHTAEILQDAWTPGVNNVYTRSSCFTPHSLPVKQFVPSEHYPPCMKKNGQENLFQGKTRRLLGTNLFAVFYASIIEGVNSTLLYRLCHKSTTAEILQGHYTWYTQGRDNTSFLSI